MNPKLRSFIKDSLNLAWLQGELLKLGQVSLIPSKEIAYGLKKKHGQKNHLLKQTCYSVVTTERILQKRNLANQYYNGTWSITYM